MSNTTRWGSPGDYNMIEVSLVLHDNTKIDIIDNALDIAVYEDMYASAITGTMLFQDNESILETYNIIGSEKIILKFITSNKGGFKTFDKTFIITKVSDFIQEGKENFYTLHFITPIGVIDKNYKISKSYDDKAEAIIQTIMDNTLGIPDKLLVDETKYPRKIVVPKWFPLTLFDYLADTSIDGLSDDDTGTGFVFYENSVGFNFRYLRGLYEDGAPFKLYENGKNLDAVNDGLDIVIDSYLPVMFNNTDNQLLGVFGNTVASHDIINKTLITTTHGYKGTLAADSDFYSTDNRFSFMSSNYDGKTASKWGGTTDADQQLFDNYRLILNIYGNTNITIGETVDYVQATNVYGADNKEHKIFPKKHLITNVKHAISNGTYTQSIELSSDRWYS